MEENQKKKSWGGRRDNSGRRRTTARRIGFNAPQDVADIISRSGRPVTEFICDAVRFYNNHNQFLDYLEYDERSDGYDYPDPVARFTEQDE